MSRNLVAIHAALSFEILGRPGNMAALVSMPSLTLAGNPVKGEKPVGLAVDDDDTIGTSQDLRKLSPTIRKAIVETGGTPGRDRWAILARRVGDGVEIHVIEASFDLDLAHGSVPIVHRSVDGREWDAPKLVVSVSRLSSDGSLSGRIEGQPQEHCLFGGAPEIDVPMPEDAFRWIDETNVRSAIMVPMPQQTQLDDLCREAAERRDALAAGSSLAP